ncbi:hypothetical protein HPB52_003046 [Rhipicephalus sanguineus]|uniref:Nlr family card domain protein n=1 Tax=Rhipicephalus sanguineus TaxID=34632 RepID=A0A9D4PGV2_RHISA|nr:hypothetical protein HPB52_003046 [Rhipicephalus sanguineus]
MDLPKSHFCDSRLNYWAPCTSSEDRPCDTIGELSLWNEFFWPVGFQLRELSPGKLPYVPPRILIHLLSHHRCIVSVDLNNCIFFAHPTEDKHKLICDAFRKSPSLRMLKLHLRPSTTTLLRSFVETLPHLSQLRDLELGYLPFDRTSFEALSEFLASTRSLTTLNITNLFLLCEGAVLIIQGLKRNATITTLSVNTRLLCSPQCRVMVSEYLRWNKTLRSLSITSRSVMTSIDVCPIIAALFHNDTLFELKLIRLLLIIPNSELITDLLIQNKTLQNFHMIECLSFYGAKCHCDEDHRVALTDGSSSRSRWLVALAESKTLQNLTLCLDWINPEDFGSFFKALACSTSLKKVTVQHFSEQNVTHICRAMRETGVHDRFFIGKHQVTKDTMGQLPECKQLSHIYLGGHSADCFVPLHTALCLLPTCSHVTSLCFEIIHELFNSELSSLMAHYIRNTTALRELDLSFISGKMTAADRAERTLLEALLLNSSIRRLSIRGLRFDDTETEMLVDILDSSRTLCDVSLNTYDNQLTISLAQKLSQNLSSNYTLLGMHLPWLPDCSGELFIIEEVVRRNSSRVTRAAHFVMGTRHKYCAAAFELVRSNPGLVEKVQELASVDENEAASRIKNSLKSMTELDDFMCLAGVVKHSWFSRNTAVRTRKEWTCRKVTSATPGYWAPCTSTEDRPCDTIGELSLWNEFFWPVGFQLRELSPGKLSLVELRDGYDGLVMTQAIRATTILLHLLSHHRCIVSVDLNNCIFFAHPTEDKHKLICDAFRKSPSLRMLKLHLRTSTTTLLRSFAETLLHLSQLRDLELGYLPFDRTSFEALSEFLASTRSLTKLNITNLFLLCEGAVLIIQGLKRNATITTLSVNKRLLCSPQCGVMVSEYLRWNKTLRSLSITSGSVITSIDVCPIIAALFHNDTLFELKLIRLILIIPNSELITDLLIQNKTLQNFHMIECESFYGVKCHCDVDHRLALTNGSSSRSRCLVALSENKTLQDLTLCLDWINPDDFGSFFKALACSTSLKKVTVQNYNEQNVTHICRAMRETGVHDRFFIGKHQVTKDTVGQLPECKQLSHIYVGCHSADCLVPLHTALCLLPTCSHVTSLCFEIIHELFNSEVSSLIAQYITNTAALRELDLSLISWEMTAADRAERTLLEALLLNSSIRRLSIRGLRFDDTETDILLKILDSSRTLCDLSLNTYDNQLTISLTQKLSKNLSSNYTLLGMHLPWLPDCSGELFIIEEVVRRNASRVTRAAHFVMGTRQKYCAAAAELVRSNPGLVEKVQQLASVDENEAASRIKKSLKSMTELDDFMCLAGVVKHSVSCCKREDAQKQLVDLNSDCWLHIRRYLKVGDILDSK